VDYPQGTGPSLLGQTSWPPTGQRCPMGHSPLPEDVRPRPRHTVRGPTTLRRMAGACRDSDSTRKAAAGRAVGAQRPRADRGVARTARSPVVAASLMALQRSAGNAAVRSLMAVPGRASGGPAAVVAQRLAEAGTTCPPAPVPPTQADPRADPKFTAVTGRVGNAAADLKKHPSGTAEADKARDAAEPPANDKAGQAKAAQIDKMAEAKPKGFDKAGFIAAVNQAIAKAAPKNLDEADKFATSGKADGIKGEVVGKVTQGREGSAKDVATATAQPPDPSVAKDKPVSPLAPASPASAPTVDGGQAMPGKAPAEQTDLRGGPCEVNSAMADAGVTDKHLTASNEPQMQQAAAAKGQAEAHAAQAPVQIRQKEDEALADAKVGATTDAKAALAAMAGVKNATTGKTGAGKSAAKTAEETERARISGDINKIYDKTKSEVEAILTGLDAQVAKVFDTGEAAARREFTAKHKADMERYKDERYDGLIGAGRWTADLFTGLPAEANQIFERAKAFYEQKMTTVISDVADIIGHELDTAKTKIATGRAEIRDYVAKQPKNLQKLATQAANDINGKFDQLESDVDDKQNSLVEDLAQKYVAARTAVDEEIKAEQAKSQGLVDMVKNAVGESVRAILALKDMFMNLLSRAASAFTMILDAPVKFITNFMNAVKQGFVQFADKILTHLEEGLESWLFGQLSASGIELPEKFDTLGVLKMIASMLGLTWASIKARIIAADPFVGKVIDVVESKIEIFTKLATMGVAGVWEWIKEKVGDVKQMIFGQIKSFVIERVVKAGITWVLGMLNPAGALFKIVQALINVVQWIMERGAEMGEFIGTIIDAVMDIARGGGGGAPDKIEAALGKAVPLVLSFLASLLGLGGISIKVREFLDKGGELVMKGVDWVVKKALTLARPIVRALKAGAGWAMKKFGAGKAWVKGKYGGAKEKVKGVVAKIRGWREGFSMQGSSHTLIVPAGKTFEVLMASVPERLKEVLQRERRLAQEARDLPRLGAITSLEDQVVEVERVGQAKGADSPVTKRLLAMLKNSIADYGHRFNRRSLGLKDSDAELGSEAAYRHQGSGGKGVFIHEHVVPGKLIAAALGIKSTEDEKHKGYERFYRSMATLTWEKEAADIKTPDDNRTTADVKTRVARGERISWSAIVSDRIDNAIRARDAAKSKITDSQIHSAAHSQLNQLMTIPIEPPKEVKSPTEAGREYDESDFDRLGPDSF
jgi:hypothetical protein